MLKHYEAETISVNREHWESLSDQTHHTQAHLIIPATSKLEAAAVLAELGYPHVGVSALRLAGGNQYAALADAGILQAGRIYVVPLSRADGIGEITGRHECKLIGRLKGIGLGDYAYGYRFVPEGPSMREELEQLAARLEALPGSESYASAIIEARVNGMRSSGASLRAILARHPEGGK